MAGKPNENISLYPARSASPDEQHPFLKVSAADFAVIQSSHPCIELRYERIPGPSESKRSPTPAYDGPSCPETLVESSLAGVAFSDLEENHQMPKQVQKQAATEPLGGLCM